MRYTKLLRDYEMKNGKVNNESIEVMYNSIDNSIAYNHDNDTYIINGKTFENDKHVHYEIYQILKFEMDLLGKEHFVKLANPYGEFLDYWLEELGQ